MKRLLDNVYFWMVKVSTAMTPDSPSADGLVTF